MVSLDLQRSEIFTQTCRRNAFQVSLCVRPSKYIMREDYIANFISEVILSQQLALQALSLPYFILPYTCRYSLCFT